MRKRWILLPAGALLLSTGCADKPSPTAAIDDTLPAKDLPRATLMIKTAGNDSVAINFRLVPTATESLWISETEVTEGQYDAAYDSDVVSSTLPKPVDWYGAARFANALSTEFKDLLKTTPFYDSKNDSDTVSITPTRLILAPYIAEAETTDTAAIIDTIYHLDSLYYLVFDTLPDSAYLANSPARILRPHDGALAVPYDTTFKVMVWSTTGDTGHGFRLPTEAEWETIAQCGMNLTYSTSNGNLSADNTVFGGTGAAAVASKAANPYGLYDMTGNLSEWTGNWWSAEVSDSGGPAIPKDFPAKTLKGGNFKDASSALNLKTTGRWSDFPDKNLSGRAGLRLVARNSPAWHRNP